MGIENRPPDDFFVAASLISDLTKKGRLIEVMAFDWYEDAASMTGPVARTTELNLDKQGMLLVEPSPVQGKSHRITRSNLPTQDEGRIFAIGYQYLNYTRFEAHLETLLKNRKKGLVDADVELPQPAFYKKIEFFPCLREGDSLSAVIDISTTSPESSFYLPQIPLDNKQLSNLFYLKKFLDFLDEDRSRTSEWQEFFKTYGANFPPPVKFSAERVLFRAGRKIEM